jgi:hypothetical protein
MNNYALFFKTLEAMGIKTPVAEHKFHPKRKWRFDLCWIKEKLALEVEGGVWVQGRHNRGSGFLKDMEKYNEASILGYHLLRVTPDQMMNGDAALLVERFFKERTNIH